MNSNCIISAENIGHKINENKLFHNLSFTLDKGDALQIRGKNGSGKSTLLRIIMGITSPTKGNIKSFFSNEVCYLGHKNALKGYLTLEDNINLMQLNRHEHLDKYLNNLNLKKYLDVNVSSLSFGQQKKLALLRVFLNNSNLIVLDEPYVGLDDDAHNKLTEFLNSELNIKKSLIFTSHISCQIKSSCLDI